MQPEPEAGTQPGPDPAEKLQKPEKPSADFPLYAHASKRWAKKIRGRTYYFGRWDDAAGALAEYEAQVSYLKQGLDPPQGDGLTVKSLCNLFLNSKRLRLTRGTIVQRTFNDCVRSCDRIVKVFGPQTLVEALKPADFERMAGHLAETLSYESQGNEINRVRGVFRYAEQNDLVDKLIRFGSEFKRADKAELRKVQNRLGHKPRRMIEANEIRALLDLPETCVQLRAMILLAVNCGLGNSDCAQLLETALDLAGGWLDFPRPKTGIARRAKLWPETVPALRAALAQRDRWLEKRQKRGQLVDVDTALRVFMTRIGKPWSKSSSSTNPISQAFSKLARAENLAPGSGFYGLRRTFETIAGESCDQVAVDHVMGHQSPCMGTNYRREMRDGRLEKVSDTVRRWLYQATGEREDVPGVENSPIMDEEDERILDEIWDRIP